MGMAKLKYKATENFIFSPFYFIAFYYYNLIGGNYDDTFGNTVTPVSAIDGRRE